MEKTGLWFTDLYGLQKVDVHQGKVDTSPNPAGSISDARPQRMRLW